MNLMRSMRIPSFVPGTLNVVSLPAGAVDNSDPNGGAAGTGLLDIDNLSIGGAGDTVAVEFEVQLAADHPWRYLRVQPVGSDDWQLHGPISATIQVCPAVTTRSNANPGPERTAGGVGESKNSRHCDDPRKFQRYEITDSVAVPHTEPLYDVRIFDDLAVSAADLQLYR